MDDEQHLSCAVVFKPWFQPLFSSCEDELHLVAGDFEETVFLAFFLQEVCCGRTDFLLRSRTVPFEMTLGAVAFKDFLSWGVNPLISLFLPRMNSEGHFRCSPSYVCPKTILVNLKSF